MKAGKLWKGKLLELENERKCCVIHADSPASTSAWPESVYFSTMHSIGGRSVGGQIGKLGAEVQGVKEELAAASRSNSDFDDEQMVSQKRQASR